MRAEDLDRAPKVAFAFAGVRCDRVVRCVLAVVAATVLAGCGERPARSDPEAGRMSY
jgi:hypothetical protein